MTAMGPKNFAAIIMAAGQGKRMNNPSMAKVLYEVGGKPMIGHVVDLALTCNADPIIAVIGHQRESVRDYLDSLEKNVATVVQEPQLGTGHAVMQAEEPLRSFEGDVLVLSGDVPLLRKDTVDALQNEHQRVNASVTVLTAVLDDPTGYGRVVRREDGTVERIVEHRDATDAEKSINEINSGIYVFDAVDLFAALKKIRPENAQSEYYLPDVFGIFREEGKLIAAIAADDPEEINGVNTIVQLELVNSRYIERT
jgi:UDP-N-acetylglucosamine diphosphorylase/glucosamine-1-phosphate N-acetyltransferase